MIRQWVRARSADSLHHDARRPDPDPRPAPARRRLTTITRSVNATWGIYIKSLESGEEVAINADRQMETMSTIKIPLMIEVFEQIKAGKFKLADKYTFVQADSQPGTGTIQRLDPGAVMTVKDLITMMIIVSDNTATEVLYRMVGGPDAVNARMHALGLKKTRAMNVPSKWFPALRAAASTEQFYRDGKNPFGLSTRARDGPAARDDGARHAGRQAVVRPDAADHARPAVSDADPALRHRLPIPHKTGDFLPYVGDDVGDARSAGTHDRRQHLHRQSFRLRRNARERDRTGGEGRRGLFSYR